MELFNGVPEGRRRRRGNLIRVRLRHARHLVFDGRPGGDDHVVLVRAERVGALAAEHALDRERHVLDADLLVDRRFVLEQLAQDGQADEAHFLAAGHVGLGKQFALFEVPFADFEKSRRGAIDLRGAPVAVAVDDLRALDADDRARRC